MKLTTDRLASLLITSALFGTNIELSNDEKQVICIESPIAQNNLNTFDEVRDKIIKVFVTDMMNGTRVLAANPTNSIDLSLLAVGNYILTLQLATGEISRKMTIHEEGEYSVVRA
ncbi:MULTISPECIES: hypothetical protein [Flammeovirga]|uniref:Uncharacterized protein n=1 Tax=Flammeovirga agarivorans TaxID=2726742 RepID=A0A7X8XZ20_9BACT|nr:MULTISPECIES: hypothetical protein [Flammeovirga]NLR94757.1 hypothetical protein [Flammeovirga agarivorans]